MNFWIVWSIILNGFIDVSTAVLCAGFYLGWILAD